MNNTYIDGQLEIDHKRGVIYFHASNKKWINKFRILTVLRICQLPVPIPKVNGRMLDINFMHGVDWAIRSDKE